MKSKVIRMLGRTLECVLACVFACVFACLFACVPSDGDSKHCTAQEKA